MSRKYKAIYLPVVDDTGASNGASKTQPSSGLYDSHDTVSFKPLKPPQTQIRSGNEFLFGSKLFSKIKYVNFLIPRFHRHQSMIASVSSGGGLIH